MRDQNTTTTIHHPYCVKCRKRMARNPNVYGGVCRWLRDARKWNPIDEDEMMRIVDSHLRGYSVEMREELRGEIVLAILSCAEVNGEIVTIKKLTPAIVREIARPLFKMQPNRFRDISLDHQYGEDGQRLEDRLEG